MPRPKRDLVSFTLRLPRDTAERIAKIAPPVRSDWIVAAIHDKLKGAENGP